MLSVLSGRSGVWTEPAGTFHRPVFNGQRPGSRGAVESGRWSRARRFNIPPPKVEAASYDTAASARWIRTQSDGGSSTGKTPVESVCAEGAPPTRPLLPPITQLDP